MTNGMGYILCGFDADVANHRHSNPLDFEDLLCCRVTAVLSSKDVIKNNIFSEENPLTSLFGASKISLRAGTKSEP